MSDYPEHDRMLAVREESQAIGAFIEDSEYALARWVKFHECSDDFCDSNHPHLVLVRDSIEAVLAAYFDIDLDKIEQEKRAMLAALRERAT